MKEIKTEIIINAEIEKVWRILVNFEKYHEWNPYIKSISGNKKVGEQLLVNIHPPGGNETTIKTLILKFEENKEFRWLGKLLFNGLFDGKHYFKLSTNNGMTTLMHGEEFSGLLLNLFGNNLDKTQSGFKLMNEAIKKECEK